MIYFIQEPKSKMIKIGVANGQHHNSIGKRFSQLQGCNPEKLKLIGYCQGEVQQEQHIHLTLQHYRYKREWFYPSDKVLELIKKLSVMTKKEEMFFNDMMTADEMTIQLSSDCNYYHDYSSIFRFVNNIKFPHKCIFGQKRYENGAYVKAKKYILKQKHRLTNRFPTDYK